jgi:hypothetical protein
MHKICATPLRISDDRERVAPHRQIAMSRAYRGDHRPKNMAADDAQD